MPAPSRSSSRAASSRCASRSAVRPAPRATCGWPASTASWSRPWTRLAEALERSAEAWRSRSWTALQVHQIERLEARDAAGETVFARDGGDWQRDGVRVEYEPVSDLLYALTGIEAGATTTDPPPSGEPLLTLVLSGDDDERRETLSLYPAGEAGASPARVDGREVTLLLDEGAVADLELKLAEARAATEPAADDRELEPLSED